MSGHYSTPRLEGRALERELAGNRGFCIRMKDAAGKFHVVSGAHAKAIRQYMRVRVAQLAPELKAQALHMRAGGADCAVTIGDETRSVDVRLWSGHRNAEALVEVKWTHRELYTAHAWGLQSVPWLQQACREGSWQRGRKSVKAGAVGVLVVRPGDWRCTLIPTVGAHVIQEFPRGEDATPKRRSRGKSLGGNVKRQNNAQLSAKEKLWRKTKGKEMTRTVMSLASYTESMVQSRFKLIKASTSIDQHALQQYCKKPIEEIHKRNNGLCLGPALR